MAETKKTKKKAVKKTPQKRVLADSKKKKVIKKKVVKKTVKKEVKKEVKKVVKKVIKKEIEKVISKPLKKVFNKYFETIGRRKTSQARIRFFTQGDKEIEINGKPSNLYFVIPELQKIIESPLKTISFSEKFKISVKVKGGGIHSQAEAVRHGISRALCLLNPYFKKNLRKEGFLTRDSRMRERKKFGLKRARRAPQWSKR